MPLYNFIINSSNVVGNYNNQFQYKFPNGGIKIPEGSEVCLANSIIPYSFYNITAAQGNNSFSFTYYSGSTPTTISVTLNDGFYTVNDINNALNTLFQYNGLFFTQTIGTNNGFQNTTNIYPFSFRTNPNNYTTELVLNYILPSNPSGSAVGSSTISGFTLTLGTAQVLQSGVFYMVSGTGVLPNTYIIGTGSSTNIYAVNISQTVSSTNITVTQNYVWTLYGYGFTWQGVVTPTHISTMIVTIPSGLGKVLGFSSQTIGPYYIGCYTSYQSDIISNFDALPVVINGNSLATYNYPLNAGFTNFTIAASSPPFAPLGSSVNAILLRCSIVSNAGSAITDVLDSIVINTNFGSNILYTPQYQKWMKINAGMYQNFTIMLNDQNFNALLAQDPNVIINVLIRTP
jgi:hypothetical protein